MTQLTAHFSLAELTRTEVRDADNTCPPALLPDLLETAAMMERIRAALNAERNADPARPVRVQTISAYRSPVVNQRVGGSANSDHLDAAAVDFRAPDFGTPYQVAEFLAKHADKLDLGQVILEFGRWVHVGRKRPPKPINRIITYRMADGRKVVDVGITEVA